MRVEGREGRILHHKSKLQPMFVTFQSTARFFTKLASASPVKVIPPTLAKQLCRKISSALWGLEGKKSNDRSLKLPCQFIVHSKPFLARKKLQ